MPLWKRKFLNLTTRAAIKDDALLSEATAEHAGAKNLLFQIQGLDAG